MHITSSFSVADMSLWKRLPASFYTRQDVTMVARELLGKVVVTNYDAQMTAGIIVETEAYNGVDDKAAHSYNNRRTNRTEVMFAVGGTAYIYLCYGLHQMLNVVTGEKDVPTAVLIRALEPFAGIDIMQQRTRKMAPIAGLSRGPGNVGKAMGLHVSQSGTSLQSEHLYIAAAGIQLADNDIGISARIGVDYAGEDAHLPYRFFIKGNKSVSGRSSTKKPA